MAVGDVVSGLELLLNGNLLTFQPAAGVEVILKSIVTGKVPGTALNVVASLYDATYEQVFWSGNHTVAVPEPVNLAVLLNNARYLRILNSTGGTTVLGYTGIQTK